MYKIPEPEIQEYRRKWLEAERDLAIKGAIPPINSLNCEPIDNGDEDTEEKSVLTPRRRIPLSPEDGSLLRRTIMMGHLRYIDTIGG